MELCTADATGGFEIGRCLWQFLNLISSIPPLDLGEGGGQDENAQNKWQAQDVLVTAPRCLWNFPRCLGTWSTKRVGNIFVWKGCSSKKGGLPALLQRFAVLFSTETPLFDCEKQTENTGGMDFTSSRFGPKWGFTGIFYAVLFMFRKITEVFRSLFAARWFAILQSKRNAQKCHRSICALLWFSKKNPREKMNNPKTKISGSSGVM